MRITGVRTVLYEYTTVRPIGDVQLPGGAEITTDLAVFLLTDEEPVGLAISSPGARPVIHSLAESLVGCDPREVRALYELMLRITFKSGTGGAIGAAIGALDCALWDLRAKARALPLWRELGGDSNRVAAYASGLDAPLDDDALVTYYRGMATRYGMSAGKLKVGREPERDLERLRLLRDALSVGAGQPQPSLMVDANEFWTPKQAIRRIRALEREFDLVWVEEPARRDDHRGLARVSRGISAAVATGENLSSVGQFMPLLLHEAVDVVQPSVQQLGITGALRVAELADAFSLPIALVNCPGRYAAHVAAVVPNHLAMEVVDAGRDAVIATDHRLEGGSILLSDAPGLGFSFDEGQLAAHAVDTPSAGSQGRAYRRSRDSGISEPGLANS